MKQNQIKDYEKINVDVIKIFKDKNRWVFKRGGRLYDMAPADIVKSALSPVVLGANRIIDAGISLKKIRNAENGFYLLFSTDYFPNSDVKLNFSSIEHGGWIYSIESIGLKVPEVIQSVWVCPYLGVHYKEIPKIIYLRVESDEDLK